MKSRVKSVLLSFLSIGLIMCSIANAEPSSAQKMQNLIKKDNLIAFISSSGENAIDENFKNSAINKIIQNEFIQTFYNTAMLQIDMGLPYGKSKMIKDLGFELIKHPCIVSVHGHIVPDNSAAPFYGMIIIDTEDAKEKVNKIVEDFVISAPEGSFIKKTIDGTEINILREGGDLKFYWGWKSNKFFISFNDIYENGVKSINMGMLDSNEYNITNLPSNSDLLSAYFNLETLKNTIDNTAFDDRHGYDITCSMLEDIGILNIKNASVRIGFEDSTLKFDSVIRLKDKNKGIWSALGSVDKNTLLASPVSPVSSSVMNIDIAKGYDLIVSAMKKNLPEEYNDFQEGMWNLKKETGYNLREDIIEAIGDEFSILSIAGNEVIQYPMGGIAITAKLRNKEKFTNIEATLIKMLKESLGQHGQINELDNEGGNKINTVMIPQATLMQVLPSWTVDGNRLIIASHPELCKKIIANFKTPSDTTSELAMGIKDLPKDCIFVTYDDNKKLIKSLNASLIMGWPFISMGLDQNGIKLPMKTPDFSSVIDSLGPTWKYSWFEGNDLRITLKNN